MRNPAKIRSLAVLVAALILASCAGSGEGTNPETTPTTTEEDRMLDVSRIDSGSLGTGDSEPRAVVAPSLEGISSATGIRNLPEPTTGGGDGTYVAVLWGEKNTGGYTVEISGANLEGERVEITAVLTSPPEGAIVSQAFTYPYAVAAIEDLDPAGKTFTVVDENGNDLGWRVDS